VPAFNYDLAATVLVEAAYSGDNVAAQKYGKSVRTIQRWRRRMAEDRHLSSFVAQKKAQAEREWAKELAPAIRAAIEFVQRAAQHMEPADPEALHAMAGALKILTEVAMTKEVLDARLAHAGGQAPEPPGEVAAANTNE